MAQYGKNFYGASYYGASGVLAGQFNSDKTVLFTPLKDLIFDIECNLRAINYQYDDPEVYRLDEALWQSTSTTIKTSNKTAVLTASITGGEFVINMAKRIVDGAIANIKATRYYNGNPVETITKTLDTKTQSALAMPETKYGDYIIEIKIDETSTEGSILEFNSLTAIVDDVSLEIKTMNSSAEWSHWARAPLVKTYNSQTNTYLLTTGAITSIVDETANVNILNAIGYEFKLMMAAGDSISSPEILELNIHTSNMDNYAPKGLWRMTIDLGANIEDITSITYDADIPKGTTLEIRSRTTQDANIENINVPEDEITWSDWTVPYSTSTKRMIIDSKTDQSKLGGVIYTPLITPENLVYWKHFIPQLFINYKDPTKPVIDESTVLSRHSSIEIQLVDANLKTVRLADAWGAEDEAKFLFREPLKKIKYFDYLDGDELELGSEYPLDSIILLRSDLMGTEIVLTENVDYTLIDRNTIRLKFPIGIEETVAAIPFVNTGKVTIPVRFKIILSRDVNYLTPAIELLDVVANAEYKETKVFGKNAIESYASAVFGNNTGEDILYMDGRGRTTVASVSNLSFTLPYMERHNGPQRMSVADYKIVNEKFEPGHASNINIYWALSSGKKISANNSDYLMAKVTADGVNIKKHIQYGSGITMSIDKDDAPDIHNITGIFYPPLVQKDYAYHLKNGHTDEETINNNVNIRWAKEDATPSALRRNIVYTEIGAQEIYTSILNAVDGDIVDWKSEEIIKDGVVNKNSPESPIIYFEELTEGLPEIPSDAIIIDSNPYKVEIIPNSVISENEIKEDSRIELSIDNSIIEYEMVTEEKVLIFRGSANTNQDFLPKSNTLSVKGIYSSLTDIAPTYWQGTHFYLVEGNKIDWSPIMSNPGYSGPKPKVGDKLYVTFTYNKIVNIKVRAESSYSRNDYAVMDIYRTREPMEFEGRCSLGMDYISDIIDIEQLWQIPENVDKTTLQLKPIVTDNPFVMAYAKDNRIVATLGATNPRENWHPKIKEGFYYIGKNAYYLFTNPNKQPLDKTAIPKAENVSYATVSNSRGVLLQEATQNLFANAVFENGEGITTTFKDTFER